MNEKTQLITFRILIILLLLLSFLIITISINNNKLINELDFKDKTYEIEKNYYLLEKDIVINDLNDKLYLREQLLNYLLKYGNIDKDEFELWLFNNHREWYLKNYK